MTDEAKEHLKTNFMALLAPIMIASLGSLVMWQLNKIDSSITKLNSQQSSSASKLASISQQIASLQRSRDNSHKQLIDLYKKYSTLEHRVTVVESE